MVVFSFLRQAVGMKVMTKNKCSKTFQIVSLTVILKAILVLKANKLNNFNIAIKMRVIIKMKFKLILKIKAMMIVHVTNKLRILIRAKLNLRKEVVKQNN